MTAITEANQFYTTPYAVFRLWADFWVGAGSDVPPLHHYKSTMSGAFLFVAPLSRPQLAAFLEWASHHQDLAFQSEGVALLDEMRWLGHWGCFSAQVQSVRSVLPMPPRTPQVPKLPK
jgi:hypothetical protein